MKIREYLKQWTGRGVALGALLLLALTASAQSWEEVREDDDYIYYYAWGKRARDYYGSDDNAQASAAESEALMEEDGSRKEREGNHCVSSWRVGVRWRGGAFRAPLYRFCADLCPALAEDTLCLCLKVFEELGLVRLSLADDDCAIERIPDVKARLDDSALLARLRRGEA